MKPLFSVFLLTLLLAGCTLPVKETPPPESVAAAEPEDKDADETKDQRLPAVDLTPRLLYQFLMAEVAGQRGYLGDAAELYRQLGQETRDPRIVRRAAEIALHARRTDIALESARLWAELEPQSPRARQTLIGLLALQGQGEELKQQVASLLAAEPQHLSQNLLHLNRLFSRGGDRLLVRTLIDEVTAPYLALAEAHYARAIAAFEARDLAGARAAAARAVALKPDWEAALLFHVQLLEDREEAIALLGRSLAAHPEWREARLAHARALVGLKRYEAARREFSVLLQQGARDPARNGDLIFAVAVLSLQLGDTREAEVHLRKLVDIGHAEADKARFYLGQIAEEGKRWAEALAWFDAVGPGEHYLPSRLHGANVLAKQGRIDEARQYLTRSDAGTPRDRVQLLIGESQVLRDAGRVADAHAALAAALAQQPDQPELIYETALLAEKLGRPEELETRLRRLIALQPDHAHALNALGYSLADRKLRLAEARALIERALALAPNDPFILDSKGWVLFRQGETEAARTVLEQAFGLRPDPEIAAHLGEVLWVLGRQAEARAVWEKARRDHPGNDVLADTIKRFLP